MEVLVFVIDCDKTDTAISQPQLAYVVMPINIYTLPDSLIYASRACNLVLG